MPRPVQTRPVPQNADALSQWSPLQRANGSPVNVAKHIPDRFQGSLSMVSWAYNEEGSIDDFVERMMGLLEQTVEDYELIVVDDGSTDKTPELLAAAAQRHPRLRVITHPRNLGIGEALATTIEAADKEFFMWQMVDWSYDIARLRQFLELLRSYDVVAGVRGGPLSSGGLVALIQDLAYRVRNRSDNLWKAVVSLTNYSLVRFLFGLPMTDYQNVVLYPTPLIKSLGMEARSSFANPELLMKAHWRGASIIEVPVGFCPRQVGEAKGTRPQAIIKSIADIFALWHRWVIKERLPAVGRPGKIRRLRVEEWTPETLPTHG